MRPSLIVALAVSSLFLAAQALAQVRVSEPWVRGTVAGQQSTGAFMELLAQHDTRLVRARSPVAQVVEIHEMTMSGTVMRMRAIAGLDLPAGRAVALTPGGYHLMLLGLRGPLKAGETVPIRLEFRDRAGKRHSLEVKAVARPLHEAGHEHHEHHMH
jgi:hypothetical protein